jgi:hypothetical protein
MLGSQFGRYFHHFRSNDTEPPFFKSGDDTAHQGSLYCIWFQNDKCLFHAHADIPCGLLKSAGKFGKDTKNGDFLPPIELVSVFCNSTGTDAL